LDPMAENAVVGQINSNSSTGNYMLPVESGKSYLLRVKSNEYLPYYERFSVDADGKIQSHYDLIGLQRQGEMNKLVITWQFFDVDQAAVKQDYMADLDNLVMVLNSIPDMNLKIVGHTDSDGSASYNLKLSKQRAESVAQYLVKSGVDSGRLKVSGAGESKPVYPNSNADFKKWNRRVELYLEGE